MAVVQKRVGLTMQRRLAIRVNASFPSAIGVGMIVMAIQITAVRWIYIPSRIAAVVGFCVSLTMQRRPVLLAIVNFWDATRGGVIAMAPMAMVVRRL